MIMVYVHCVLIDMIIRCIHVRNFLKIGKNENTVFSCTTDVLRSLLITECKTVTGSSLLLPLTKFVFLCTSTIINSPASSVVYLTKFLALFIPINSIILFHIFLSFIKSSLSSLSIDINVILFFNLCISPKKIFSFLFVMVQLLIYIYQYI